MVEKRPLVDQYYIEPTIEVMSDGQMKVVFHEMGKQFHLDASLGLTLIFNMFSSQDILVHIALSSKQSKVIQLNLLYSTQEYTYEGFYHQANYEFVFDTVNNSSKFQLRFNTLEQILIFALLNLHFEALYRGY